MRIENAECKIKNWGDNDHIEHGDTKNVQTLTGF
jgi:hypothetical protein